MATRRGGSRGKARGKQAARRRRSGATSGPARGRRAAGARRARTTAAAREVRSTPGDRTPAAEPRERLRLAEPPRVEPPPAGETAAEAAALHDARRDAGPDERTEAAEMARRIEAAAGSAMDDLRRRTEAASRELSLRREEREAEARPRDEERILPGAASMGLELAVGALRLVGAMVTAPVRIGLAFLRPREA